MAKEFLMDLEVVPSAHSTITLFYDNSGAVSNSKESQERKYHLIREIINRGNTKVSQIASEDNLADPFTNDLT